MKALLIIDMPHNCADCDFSEWRKDQDWGDGDYCSINGGQCLNCKRPDGCPLRPLPQPMEVCGKYPQPGQPVPSYRIGWNDCLNKITGNFDFDRVRKALKKQIPMKPLNGGNTDKLTGDIHICPSCSGIVGIDDMKAAYCADCGQKLDWEN